MGTERGSPDVLAAYVLVPGSGIHSVFEDLANEIPRADRVGVVRRFGFLTGALRGLLSLLGYLSTVLVHHLNFVWGRIRR